MAKKKQPPTRFAALDPLHVIRRAQALGITEIAVSFSGGRDSLAVLDLCCKHFTRVHAYFMYIVPGLSFQESFLSYIERKYSLSILRIPHWALSRMLQSSIMRHPTHAAAAVRITRVRHVEAYLRKHYNSPALHIANGCKYSDSLERNTQIQQCDGICPTTHRVYPIGFWTQYDVQSYLTRNGITMPPDYRLRPQVSSRRRGQFGSLLTADELLPIRDAFPQDFRRICQLFPQAEAMAARFASPEFQKQISSTKSGRDHGKEKSSD